jgi:lipopolysaccharide/colanic/teichoic acid biosynthesis glycosyltransferase
MSREQSHGPARDFPFVVKRVFDILTAAIALILLSPLFLLVAIAIKIDSSGATFRPTGAVLLRQSANSCLKVSMRCRWDDGQSGGNENRPPIVSA